jgi:ElaB/YqjD/DUF883 family membrane-anchored ribosome-binding protein
MKSTRTTLENVLDEMRSLLTEAEKVVTRSARDGGEAATAALRERFKAAQEQLGELYDDARNKVAAGAKYTDATIREHPYSALAVAAGIGIVAGVLLSRCCSSDSD